MAVVNAVGNALTGATGSGNFVGANTPTLITPVLGVATATSINFGGGALDAYVPVTTFTPAFAFATAGDLSVSYAVQQGYYARVGNRTDFWINMTFTPTFTTSSGNARITGLAIAASTNLTVYTVVCQSNGNVTFSAGCTALTGTVSGGASLLNLTCYGSGASSNTLSTTNFTTGVSTILRVTGSYAI